MRLHALWILLCTGGPGGPPDSAALAKAYGGRIWTVDSLSTIPDADGAELARWLETHPQAAEVTHKGRDSPWVVQLVAIFERPISRTRLRVRVLEEDAVRLEVAQRAGGRSIVLRARCLLDPRRGFHAAPYRLEVASETTVLARGGFSLVD